MGPLLPPGAPAPSSPGPPPGGRPPAPFPAPLGTPRASRPPPPPRRCGCARSRPPAGGRLRAPFPAPLGHCGSSVRKPRGGPGARGTARPATTALHATHPRTLQRREAGGGRKARSNPGRGELRDQPPPAGGPGADGAGQVRGGYLGRGMSTCTDGPAERSGKSWGRGRGAAGAADTGRRKRSRAPRPATGVGPRITEWFGAPRRRPPAPGAAARASRGRRRDSARAGTPASPGRRRAPCRRARTRSGARRSRR